MLTERVSISFVNYDKSDVPQVLIQFFPETAEDGSEPEYPWVEITVGFNPDTGQYDRCNTVDDLDSDDDQDDDDRKICINLAAAFVRIVKKSTSAIIDPAYRR